MSDARGCSRRQKDAQSPDFIEYGEDFEGFWLNKKLQKSGELGLHKAPCQSFSDDNDDF